MSEIGIQRTRADGEHVRLRGKADISDWLADVMTKTGHWRVRPIADLTAGKKPL